MSLPDVAQAPAETARQQPRVLVVDDERSMRELLEIVLRREGYDVVVAENGRSAIEVIEREPIDLLISDIKMPDMSGVEVLRAAKKADQDVLAIMVTAFASTETAVEAMRLGACDYLSKPFTREDLAARHRQAVVALGHELRPVPETGEQRLEVRPRLLDRQQVGVRPAGGGDLVEQLAGLRVERHRGSLDGRAWSRRSSLASASRNASPDRTV